MVKLIWTLLVLSSKILPNFCVRTKIECGYKQCPLTRDGALNVHLIPHSHMDAGWVKTFDEYYYGNPQPIELKFGKPTNAISLTMQLDNSFVFYRLHGGGSMFSSRATISTANVQLIYHSVLSELLHDKRRKFTFSETAYFWRWWKEQRPNTRATFRSLVQEGRVEFAGGGWTHGDSATVGYLHSLDMWTWGLRKLNDTLGPCGKPKAAWQIDTYGHTREQASLLAQMGFDGLFLGRVDHKERIAMMEEDRMEFMWRGSDVLGKMSDIMTHTLYNLYNPPEGFCFDFLCNDEPLVDDPDTKLYNADKRVNDFIAQIERQAKYYDHDNILVTMGGDFTYQSAANWFMNMDKLINHVNTHPANMSDINIFYSTPSCYLKALYLYGRRDKAIFTERGDQLPYGSDETTYWTGFYTSRPSFKYLVRKVHVFLQIVKQLTVIVQSGDSYELHLLRHAVGLVIHHDAITGTSQQHVTNDFIRILSEAVDICSKKASHLLTYLTPTWGANRRSKNSQTFILCHQLNITQCRFVETQEATLLLVYNPLSIKTYHFVRLPALALHYSIRDFNDEEVEYQLLPLPAAAIDLPGRVSNAIQEIYFEAENIPAMGYSAYYIAPIQDQVEDKTYSKKTKEKEDMEAELIPQISNEYLKVSIDKNGLLDSISHVDGVKIQLSQNFYYYSQPQRPLQSGAYCFRADERPVPVTTEKVPHNTIRGALIREIRQRFSDWVTQIIRLYRGEEFVELEWIVGPVPTGTDLGKEVVSIFSTNISNNGEFYTDANGRQMMKRSCWNETTGQPIKKPVPACYYPVTTRICIKAQNASIEMCVLPDRTQGGTSYNEGEIELMIHRRLLTDDGFGLDENLNEEAYGIGLVVKGRHRIYFANYRQEVEDMTFSERVSQAARRWEYEPWLFFASGDKINRRKWQNVRNKRYSALKLHGLPRHVHVLTLEPWKANSVLLRLENTLEQTTRGRFKTDNDVPEDPKSHITVELRKIFLQLKIKQVRETTLAANQWLDDARQMDWSTRYVYSGGEDGILAEDKEVEEEVAIPSVPSIVNNPRDLKREDPDNNSYEEREYRRVRKQQKRNRNGKRNDEFVRRKRSTNETITTPTLDLNDMNFKITMNDSMAFNQTIETTTLKLKKKVKLQRQTQKSSFFNKPSHKVPNWEFDDEIRSSEEDFSSNLKKRSPRKKKSKMIKEKEEFFIDDSDDGVTKSIYEMYYKTPPAPTKMRARNRKTVLKSERGREMKKKSYSGEVNMNPYSAKRTRGDGEYNRDFKGAMKVVKRRGVRRDYDDYTETEDDDEDDDYDRTDEKKLRSRYKRMAHEENPEPQSAEPEITEPDYIITLRPTQIRTFIIWFESSKRQYTT